MAADLDALIGRLTAAQKRALLWLPADGQPRAWTGEDRPQWRVLFVLAGELLAVDWRAATKYKVVIAPSAWSLTVPLGQRVRARLAAMEGGDGE